VAEGRVRGALDELLVEASPLSTFETAAGHFIREGLLPARGEKVPEGRMRGAGFPTITLPAEVVAAYRGPALYLRVIDPKTGDVLAKMSA